jgi:eukaryotic-like serine/threonine-protein kinase
MTVTLTIIDGTRQGKSYHFDDRTICWVGRQDNCTIQFPESDDYGEISRLHCLLDIDPPKISVRDFNSKHGTYVDAVLIGKRPSGQVAPQGMQADIKPVEKNLHSGNIITIGNSHIKVTITGEQPDYAPSLVTETPKGLRAVADKVIGWIPDKAIDWFKYSWLEMPQANPANPQVGNQPNSPANPQAKEAIGGYKVVKQVGEGGYGQVFLAENAQGQQVAIKIMLAEVAATPTKVAMFGREIDNAKALNHPNVVRLVDNGFDASSNCLYYVMEYCAGDNLSTFMKIKGGVLDLDAAKRIILQVLDGLEYTHSAEIPFVRLAAGGFAKGVGLVHRDLKPSNIMLATTNMRLVAKIGDFGLSKAFDQAGLSGHTMSGDGFRGTAHFMCRKQVLEFQMAKPEVDIWAAAACLYYMLTNQHPRTIGAKEGWEVLLDRDVTPIRDRNPDVPLPVAEVIDRALHEGSVKDPVLHYQRVADFRADLLKAFEEVFV